MKRFFSIALLMGVITALAGQSGWFGTVALGETNKPVKGIKINQLNPGQVRRAPLKFAEVEIVLSEQLSLADISGLPRAPRSDLEVLDGGQRVRVQLPASVVKALIEEGAEISVVRNFILFEGGAAGGGKPDGGMATWNISAVDFIYGSNTDNYHIVDNTPIGTYSAVSPIDISTAPEGARVTFIDVDWEVYHQWPGDVVVLLRNERLGSPQRILWYRDYHTPGYFGETVESISEFYREMVNQQWQLCAGDWASGSVGYIYDWWIKVWYDVPTDYCEASGGGDIYIGGVEVGTISNTGTGSNYYVDYRESHSTEMEIGTGYPITVTTGNPYDEDDECGIWVDWNQDLDFTDAGEQISVSGVWQTFWATITPPPAAVLGDTCMRVRIWWGGTLGPCGGSSFGEVEDYTVTVTSAASFVTISGYVRTGGGVGIDGVLVSASSGESDTTAASGYYELSVESPWSGTVTPSKSNWSFSPPSRSYSSITTNQPAQNYTGTYTADPTPTISGYVKMGGGVGIQDVLVSASTGESTATGSGGYYELTVSSSGPVPSPWSGTVTPSKDHWSFDPVNIVYSDLSSDIADQDYTGTYVADPTPTISGHVKTSGGAGIKGVEVSGDNFGGSAITDADGYYELTVPDAVPQVPRPWSGTVTPGKTDWSFNPVNIVYTDLSSDVGNQNYTGSYVGLGCAAGWIEEWVAWYHGDEVQLYADLSYDIAVDSLGNVYVTGSSVDKIGGDVSYDYATVKYDSSGVELWAARYDGTANGNDDSRAVAVDNSGNVYVTGGSQSVTTSKDYTTIKYGPDSNEPVWVAKYNGPGNLSDEAKAIAVDDSGNIYVTGYSMGDGTDDDFATIKYGPDSNVPLWVSRYSSAGNYSDGAEAIAVDDSGNVYVGGSSYDSVTKSDFVTIKYDPNGNELWVAKYNGPGGDWDGVSALAVDDSGNVYVTGSSEGIGTGHDYTTIKYDSGGNEVWVAGHSEPGDVDDEAYAIALDGLGNVYVTGIANWYDRTSGDYVTIKYGSDSNEPLWVARYNGPGNLQDVALDMALDDSGNIYVTGISDYIRGTIHEPASGGDYATVKYGPDSNEPVWVAVYAGPPGVMDIAQAVAVDDSDNVYVAGFNNAYVTIKYSQCTMSLDLDIDELWMYQNLPAAPTSSNLTASVSVADDPAGNSSYSYDWEIILPGDVTLSPITVAGGGSGDAYWTFAARSCDEPAGLSDSGQAFTVRVTVTGDDFGNTGTAKAEFGIALLGDVNNDGLVDVADRGIIHAFWLAGAAGHFTFKDCNINCDTEVDVADRGIVHAIWLGALGQDSVSNPCPLR